MDLLAAYPDAQRTGFGDSPELSAQLLDLIRQGRKTATCGALRDYQAEGEPVPNAGEIMIADDWDGEPALAYRLTDVTVCSFAEVTEDFALAEGEGDFDDWREGHEAFFARNGGFDPSMLLVCERFELLAVSEASDKG